jgi:hypothetical protein
MAVFAKDNPNISSKKRFRSEWDKLNSLNKAQEGNGGTF